MSCTVHKLKHAVVECEAWCAPHSPVSDTVQGLRLELYVYVPTLLCHMLCFTILTDFCGLGWAGLP